MALKFTKSSEHFMCRCNETMEEEDFATLPECLAFAARGRRLMPDEPLSFTITRVREAETEI